ncbi:MAG: RagB/SusD family nutrient uptake outer membrane protein [Odoribacter sp.]|nr:RagB/SusD family nutrient uptake outer membrane protein [Odoribacter sp.]
MRKIYGTFLVLLFASCSNFLQEYSQDLSRVETYTDLDEVLLGDGYLPMGRIYTPNSSFRIENKYFQAVHYMSDELDVFSWDGYGDRLNIQEEMFGWHTWQKDVGQATEGNSRVDEDKDWNKAYHCINTCNMVLALIDEQKTENEREELEKMRIKGEATFLRGLYYFTLANLYGEPYSSTNLHKPAVPLKLSEVIEDKNYTTNTVKEVYDQVMEDLDLAEECLSVQEAPKNHPYRADITALYLLKSRVYLYMQNWKSAYEYAKKALEKKDGLLDLNALANNNGDVLTKSSVETIFSMGGHLLSTSIYNLRYYSYGALKNLPVYLISDDLVTAFEEGENDLRTRYYIVKEDSIGGGYEYTNYAPGWVFAKVKGWKNLGYKEVSDNFLFRTAEAYLNGAEAAALNGQEGEARALLQKLRDNRLVDSRPVSESGEELVSLIRKERQRELCLEGHRWFDLRRYMVREKFPYTKTIAHHYTKFNYDEPEYSLRYILEPNDPAYTLALPREVLEFRNTLGANHRPARSGSDYIPDIPEAEMSDAYWEGFEAGKEAGLYDLENDSNDGWNRRKSENPYDEDEDEDAYWDWRDGFEDGYEESY